MERQFKFRFWNIDKKCWYGKGVHLHKVCYDVDNEEMHTNYITEQFTGLKDKNGVEIYEGDVYHQGDPKIKHEVIFKEGAFVGKQMGNNSTAGLSYWIDRIEVVGNTHE